MGTPRRTAAEPTSRDLLILYISEALRSKVRSTDGIAYIRVVEELSQLKRSVKSLDEDRTSYLVSLLCSLAACLSLINQQAHESLLSEVLGLPIWGTAVEVRQALLALLTHLVVINGSLTQQCLHKLVGGLLPPPFVLIGQDADALEADAGVDALQQEVCTTIERILALVPTAASQLVAVAAGSMPHVLRDRAVHVLYVRAVARLALGRAVPAAVRAGLLAVVVEHLVALDCEIRWQDIAVTLEDQEDEDDQPEEDEDIFQLEGQTEQLHVTQPGVAAEAVESARDEGARGGFEGTVASSRADATAQASTSAKTAADYFAEKLDSLMEVVLAQLETAVDQGQAAALWAVLLPVFQRSILRTHRCKFAQYLVWYLCLKEPVAAPHSLVSTLLSLLTAPSTTESVRCTSASYLASFLARARFIPADMIITTLHALARWCLAYCRARPARPNAEGPGSNIGTPGSISLRANTEQAARDLAAKHQVFYAASQSIFYIVCYRLEGVMHQGSEQSSAASPAAPPSPACLQMLKDLFATTMPQLLSHWLAPLSVCIPSVALEFVALTQRLALLPPTSAPATTQATARAQRPLETFFPFDPYLLRKSAARLQLRSSYLRWGQVKAAAEVYEAEAEAEAEDEAAGSEEEADMESSSSSESDSDASGASSSDESEMEDDALDRRKRALVSDSSELGSLPKAGLARRRKSQERADVLGESPVEGSALSPEPSTPPGHLSSGMPVPGRQRSSAHALASHQVSRGSSPDVGSGTDPMSWTPHLLMRLAQQTA